MHDSVPIYGANTPSAAAAAAQHCCSKCWTSCLHNCLQSAISKYRMLCSNMTAVNAQQGDRSLQQSCSAVTPFSLFTLVSSYTWLVHWCNSSKSNCPLTLRSHLMWSDDQSCMTSPVQHITFFGPAIASGSTGAQKQDSKHYTGDAAAGQSCK